MELKWVFLPKIFSSNNFFLKITDTTPFTMHDFESYNVDLFLIPLKQLKILQHFTPT